MEYPWDIVASICASVVCILLLLGICFRVRISRLYKRLFQRPRAAHPGLPPSLQRAMIQLGRVTENRGRKGEARVMEERECPICLASLYSSPASSKRGSMPAPVSDGIDLEAGLSRTTTLTATSITESMAKITTPKEVKCEVTEWQPQPIEDEVLKMKRCQHMFHARCLATWFLRKRYDCPVCRTLYFQPAVEPQSSRDDIYAAPPPTLPVLPFW